MLNDFTSILRNIVDRFSRFLRELASAPRIIWEWSEKSTLARTIVYAAAAVAAAMLIAAVVSTIRTLTRTKKLSLFAPLFVSLLICVGMWIARDQIVVFEIPEPESIPINGELVLPCRQYSLARGILETDPIVHVNPPWHFVDDTLNFAVDEDSILQLSGLRSFYEERQYLWHSLQRTPQLLRLEADWSSPGSVGETTRDVLILIVFPDVRLSETGWYLDAGETQDVTTAYFGNIMLDYDGKEVLCPDRVHFEILENDGDRIIALAKASPDEEIEVCVAQQIGDDLVLARCRAYHRTGYKSGKVESRSFTPDTDLQEREYMLSPLLSLFDGRVRLLQDLTAEQTALLLPERIVDYPVRFSLNTAHVSFPCREIVKMGSAPSPWIENYAEEMLQFTGAGPNGKEYLYTLINASDQPLHDISAELRQKKPALDTDVSAFIGVKAYIYQDGWLICLGSNNSTNGEKQYYYMTIRPTA